MPQHGRVERGAVITMPTASCREDMWGSVGRQCDVGEAQRVLKLEARLIFIPRIAPATQQGDYGVSRRMFS